MDDLNYLGALDPFLFGRRCSGEIVTNSSGAIVGAVSDGTFFAIGSFPDADLAPLFGWFLLVYYLKYIKNKLEKIVY